MNNKFMKIAILGGTGQLGNYLSSYLSINFSVTSFSSQTFPFPNVNIVKKLSKFDIIINCVGFPYRWLSRSNNAAKIKSRKLNYDFAIYIANYSKKAKKKLIHISTSSVYSSPNIYLHKENEYNKNPNVPYEKHKLLADLYIENNLLDYIIIRPYNLHSNPIHSKPFYNTITSIISNAKDEIVLIAGITAQFVSGKVIGDAILHLLNKKLNGTYNLSALWIYRIKLIEIFLKLIQKTNIPIRIVNHNFFNVGQIQNSLMDCTKIVNTGFKIPSTCNDVGDWWNNQLSANNKKYILNIIMKIEHKSINNRKKEN